MGFLVFQDNNLIAYTKDRPKYIIINPQFKLKTLFMQFELASALYKHSCSVY